MERKAAVNYLLSVAEHSKNAKFSSIVNDLARRVAMSIEETEINLEKHCSKMAAELMFRDDYFHAYKLMKIAANATKPDPNILPLTTDEETETETVEQPEPVNQTQKFIDQNLPQPSSDSQSLSALGTFMERLKGANVEVIVPEQKPEEEAISQEDSKNNLPQTVDDSNPDLVN